MKLLVFKFTIYFLVAALPTTLDALSLVVNGTQQVSWIFILYACLKSLLAGLIVIKALFDNSVQIHLEEMKVKTNEKTASV